jgi:hypothetical protein
MTRRPSPPLSREDIASIVGAVPKELERRVVGILEPPLPEDVANLGPPTTGSSLFTGEEQRAILTQCHANVLLAVNPLKFGPSLSEVLQDHQGPEHLMLASFTGEDVRAPSFELLSALRRSRVVRELVIDGDGLEDVLNWLPKRLSVLGLPPLERAPTRELWENFWEAVGNHPTLTTVIIPQRDPDTTPPQPIEHQPDPDAVRERLLRTVILYGAIKKSYTLVSVNHDAHPTFGPWGVDEACFNGPIAQLLAANGAVGARAVAQGSCGHGRRSSP